MNSAIELEYVDLAIATALVVVAGLVSLAFRLRLESKLLVASVRTVVQLLLLGFALQWVFRLDHGLAVIGIVFAMVFAASRAAVARSSRRYRGVHIHSFVTLALTGITTTLIVTEVVVGVDPWYQPQYVIPLLGMVFGNSLTGISLCLDHALESLDRARDRIEADLASGATRMEAFREPYREAVRRGMVPILNSMTVVGIVSIPGMMTGQILQGGDPVQAVKYQILIMFMIAAATALSCVLIVGWVFRSVFDSAHRLRAERIQRRAG